MSDRQVLTCTKKELAEKMIRLDSEPFSLEDYPFLVPIYNGHWDKMLLKCGRQVAKTTTAQNLIITNSIAIDHFNSLYISPSQTQSRRFSNSKLQKTIDHSPMIQHEYVNPSLPMNVSMKRFDNGSEVNISYASDDPDRVRGISSDMNIYDEVQDIEYKSVIPVIDETLSASKYGWKLYMGTPKSMENTIEMLWQRSTQDEWVMKCERCNKWNVIRTADSLGKEGPICLSCGRYLKPRNGHWHSMNPSAEIKGFHVPQPILPSHYESQRKWERVLYKYENYATSEFRNEVLGVSDAAGTRMVSQEELEALCEDYTVKPRPKPHLMEHVVDTVAGVDWSGGGSSLFDSRTVVWIWGIMPDGQLQTLYFKIFNTHNPVEDVREVAKVCSRFDCSFVGGDAGVGATANAMLRERLGEDTAIQMQYGSVSKLIQWNNKDRYMIDKTAAIDSMMMKYKKDQVIFPNKKQCKRAIEDILNEFAEITKKGRGKKQWKNNPESPDDALHAQVFGMLAAQIAQGRVEFYEPEVSGVKNLVKKGR